MSPALLSRRWWLFAVLVFAGQLGMIFWLSDDSSALRPRRSTSRSISVMTVPPNELFALNDPTLFALPHSRGFSGKSWAILPAITNHSFEWHAELEWLPLPASQLGEGLARFLQNNPVERPGALPLAQAELIQPELPSGAFFNLNSSIHIEGALQHRRLLTMVQPSAWPHSDLLTNTIVDLLVGLDGLPISCELRPPGSGSVQADQQALSLARSARFESLVSSGPQRSTNVPPLRTLTRGTMVFRWRTLPSTNSVSP